MVIKNEEYILDIVSQGYEGEGVAKIDSYPIFIEGALKGEKVKVKIVKVNKNFAYGKLLEVIEKSEGRVEPKCKYFKKCGGCKLQHMNYETQLDFKWERVKDCIKKIGGLSEDLVEYPIGMEENPYKYRNKVQLPIGMDKSKPVLGFYAPRSHDIIDIEECLIQEEDANKISKITREWIEEFNIMPAFVDGKFNKKGLLRHVMIRKGFKTGEVMVVIVATRKDLKHIDELIKKLEFHVEGLKSVVLCVNAKDTNVILTPECYTLWGEDYIQDYIGDFKFNISPLSFFQVNPMQTEVLYNKVLEYAELTGKFVAMCVFGHEVEFKDLTLYTKVGELNTLNHTVIFNEKMDFKATNTRGVIFSNKTSKYYGYTHRGICGFGIGDMLFDIRNENDYLYYKDCKLRIRFIFNLIKNIRNVIMFKSYIEDGIKIITPFNKRGSKKIETLEEAKKAAINFMKYLS